jgi:hypothetical protein
VGTPPKIISQRLMRSLLLVLGHKRTTRLVVYDEDRAAARIQAQLGEAEWEVVRKALCRDK